jgi:hypothetical protein
MPSLRQPRPRTVCCSAFSYQIRAGLSSTMTLGRYLGGMVQADVAACISPAEVFDASSGQLAKVAYLATSDFYGRRVAGLYITSDPWSRMTCVVAETPSNTWASYMRYLYVAFFTQVRCTPLQYSTCAMTVNYNVRAACWSPFALREQLQHIK